MLFSFINWVRNLKSRLSNKHRLARVSRFRKTRCSIEYLEDRVMLAAPTYIVDLNDYHLSVFSANVVYPNLPTANENLTLSENVSTNQSTFPATATYTLSLTDNNGLLFDTAGDQSGFLNVPAPARLRFPSPATVQQILFHSSI